MSQSGLQAVLNPSEIFMSEEHSDSEFLVGLAVALVMDGLRAFLIEIQVYLHKLELILMHLLPYICTVSFVNLNKAWILNLSKYCKWPVNYCLCTS